MSEIKLPIKYALVPVKSNEKENPQHRPGSDSGNRSGWLCKESRCAEH